MNGDPSRFEEPILALRRQLDDLATLGPAADRKEIEALEKELLRVSREVYATLTPWQKTLVARNAGRPYTLDFVDAFFEDFVEVHGDRRFADDRSIICGFALFDRAPCAIIGHQKGRDTREKVLRNFGMPRPEGYRKALRVMKLAEKFNRPIFTFIDTPGAYPGVGAEERGQAEAIAVNLREMAALTVPIIVTVTGEGGSGGALALGVGDRILMLEHAVYSVISPEGCAAILWKSPDAAQEAAEAMRITAQHLLDLGIIDEIVPEPVGGAHSRPEELMSMLRPFLEKALKDLQKLKPDQLRAGRYEKFRRMGIYADA